MKYKMFVSDYDGTLGNAPDYIAPENIEAIAEYKKRGGKFVVCTGRELRSIRNILLKYNIEGDVIATQGSVIADIQTGKLKLHEGIEAKIAADVIDYFAARNDHGGVAVNYENELFFLQENQITAQYEKLVRLTGILDREISAKIRENGKPVQKVIILCDPADFAGLSANFYKKFGDRLIVNSGAAGLMEIIEPAFSKGLSVKRLAQEYGIKPEEVIAVGDSTNDLGLMQCGFYGVAVGDGTDELKRAAAEVTLPYAQRPIAYLLKKYCL